MGASLYNLKRISVSLAAGASALIFCTLAPFTETTEQWEKTNWHIYYSNSPKLKRLSQSLEPEPNECMSNALAPGIS